VVFFQPPDPGYPQIARLVFTTPGRASALPTIHTEARAWEDSPTQCGGQVCASALTYDTATKTWKTLPYRINPQTGASGPDTHAPSGYRELGSGLVDLLGRRPEKLARRDHDRTVWVRTLTDLTGPGVSSDNGWSTHQFQHDAITTLTLYRNSRPPAGVRDYRLDLSTGIISVGLDTKTGKLLWRRIGESIGCETSLVIPDDEPISCAYRGYWREHYDPATEHTTTKPDHIDVTLQRFDPATGQPTWSQPLGAATVLAGYPDGAAASLLSDTEIRTGGHVIDLATGAQRPTTPHDVFWCTQMTHFEVSAIPDSRIPGPAMRFGQGVTTLCTATGQPTTEMPTALPSELTATSGTLHIIATPTSLVAYRTV